MNHKFHSFDDNISVSGFSDIPSVDNPNQQNQDAIRLINELCQFHKIKPEYELIDVQGPDHFKIFTIYLKLGVSEKHYGQGNSIQKARHNAAKNALERTRLKFPSNNKPKKLESDFNRIQSIQTDNNYNNVPFPNHWNDFLTKGIPTRLFNNELNRLSIGNVPQSSLFPYFNSIYHLPNFYPTFYGLNPFSFQNYFNFPTNINYFDPNYYLNLETFQYNRMPKLNNSNSIHVPVRNQSPFNNSNENQQNKKQSNDQNIKLENNSTKEANSIPDPSQKNSIALVYQTAYKNKLKVEFNIVSNGCNYKCNCCLFDRKNGQLKFEINGEDRSKKSAKKLAAQNMLNKIANENLSSNQDSINGNDNNKDMDSVSNKFVTLLYNVTRNMSIREPIFYHQVIDAKNPIVNNYTSAVKCKSNQIHRVETILFFPQTDSQHCSIKAFGFALNQSMAKKISSYIIQLKMGLKLPSIASTDQFFYNSLKFSITENSNLPKTDIDNIIDQTNNNPDPLDWIDNREFKINYQFVLFILRKFYHYALKNTEKHCDLLSEKIQFLLPNFKENYSEIQFNHFDEVTIQKLISQMDLTKYWNHLRLITKLLSMGINLENNNYLIEFKDQVILGDINNETMISFINVRLNDCFNAENFHLINKHYVTYGFGNDENEAREQTSLRVLNHLVSNSLKYHFDTNKMNNLQESLQQNDLNDLNEKKSSSSSKPSKNQKKCKDCLSYMYDVCHDLFIHKPDFLCFQMESQNEPKLYHCRCTLAFHQDSISSKLKISAIANSKRLSRTIASYLFLSMVNTPELSLSKLNVFTLPDFEKYLKYSLENNTIQPNHLKIIDISPLNKSNSMMYDDDKTEEILRNLDFIEFLLKDVYQSHLKNQKRSNPNHFFSKVEEKLFEYHNHRKQIMDQSDSFDRWSHHVKQWIQNTMNQLDGTKYWNHLKLISIIASTLNQDLNKILNPLVFEFKCQLIPNEIEQNKENWIKSIPGFIAIISIHCSSQFFKEKCVLLKKEFLSFAINCDANEACEFASYKALRYLAINLWKSNL